ncbi:hypothetical protein AMTRI_Chr04g251030 [Amborella trichopoda]
MRSLCNLGDGFAAQSLKHPSIWHAAMAFYVALQRTTEILSSLPTQQLANALPFQNSQNYLMIYMLVTLGFISTLKTAISRSWPNSLIAAITGAQKQHIRFITCSLEDAKEPQANMPSCSICFG